MKDVDIPVLIVGAGPVGLTLSLLLARRGIEHVLVERRSGVQRAPAAHAVNARTFEIFRQAGVDAAALAAASLDPADAGFVHWVTRLGGEVLGRVPYERQGDDVLDLTPTPLRNLSQHRLEPILVAALAGAGAAPPRYGHEWLAAEPHDGAVTARIRDTTSGETYAVTSRYLLAADGAGSPVRRALGIAPIGPDRLQSFVMIHFEANLRHLVERTPGVLYFLCDPECPGVLVAHDIDREWVYMHPFDPQRESRERYDAATCERLVRGAVPDSAAALAIRTVSLWTMTAQVVDRYRDGRIYLVGDAAHRFPPTGGLGLNTGVQDAHNLIWKIAAVEAGQAPAALLDTYELERRPVAQHNAEQSLRNAMRLLEVQQALGFCEDLDAARARLAAVLATGELRAGVAAAIANQAEHFDMLGLQLGFAYEQGALVDDGTERPTLANPVRDFVPTARPGSRLPHGWITRNGARLSTLDLIGYDAATLFVGALGAGWIEAALAVDPSLRWLRVGIDFADSAGWWRSVAGMAEDGALLVRPDQHVAFRSRTAGADRRSALAGGLAALRGRGG